MRATENTCIYVDDEPMLDGPTSDEIARATGYHRASVYLIDRESRKLLQVRLISECVARALPTWTVEASANVVAFVVRSRMGERLFYGDTTIDQVLDAMDAEASHA